MEWSCREARYGNIIDMNEDCLEKLLGCLSRELEKDDCDINTHECGEVTDMIRDLAHVEKDYYEAWYYYCKAKRCEDEDDDDEDSEMPAHDCASHYEAFKSATDIPTRNMHANGYVNVATATMKEMFGSVDADTKRKMKADLTRLVSEMPI